MFGGLSREREISFAGGRTVYDNLNKSLFDAVPLFVDSFGNFVLLDWEYIYKGSIRDFYPPVEFLTDSPNEFQVYAESLGSLSDSEQEQLISSIGRKVSIGELPKLIDFAFLCLHGPNGEDGRIQGLFEYIGIPYSGSGILSSAIGINKATQKQLMKEVGFESPSFFALTRSEWKNETSVDNVLKKIKDEIRFPCVIKPANQGSSIGITILHNENLSELTQAINHAFFIDNISIADWKKMTSSQRVERIRNLTDIRSGIGIPVYLNEHYDEIISHPEELLLRIDELFLAGKTNIKIESADSESEVMIEGFIEGKEFSCIVIRNENKLPIALPPTEIRKGKELFDYRSKYLPGLSRKITPIEIETENIQRIRKECERLFLSLKFNVYARIDGFINTSGTVFLNDPNTTSGMMPSSFFFHQAAEIGLNPSQFLTYIIRTSLTERLNEMRESIHIEKLRNNLDLQLISLQKNTSQKIRVAVIMGGYSSERHISVESGRNIYEKLASSEKYAPIPVFLTGNDSEHILYQIPVNLMLKDNADDIKEKAEHFNVHPVIQEIMRSCKNITGKYTSNQNVLEPKCISYEELSTLADEVFIALHGRPGEDGEVQKKLDTLGLPYNGSGVESSKITINKFETNEILRQHGFLVAQHALVNLADWKNDRIGFIKNICAKFRFPFIAKPVDDGCSSAVKKIKNEKELEAFSVLMFREDELLPETEASLLQLKQKEEFPRKQQYLIEELIDRNGADHFLEITGGLLTKNGPEGERVYELFEASETLSEGDVLSLEEKFLAGQGQNITPARYSKDPKERQLISDLVKEELKRAAALLNIEGYARIDAFVRIFKNKNPEVIFIEVNSLPGMTPATCIFHQSAIAGYPPYQFIDHILEYGAQKKKHPVNIH